MEEEVSHYIERVRVVRDEEEYIVRGMRERGSGCAM